MLYPHVPSFTNQRPLPSPCHPRLVQHYSQAGSAGAFTAYQTADHSTTAAAAAGGGEQGEGVDITFTATTSKSGSLLVGSSRCARGGGRASSLILVGTPQAPPLCCCTHYLSMSPFFREFAGFDNDAPEAVVQAIMRVRLGLAVEECARRAGMGMTAPPHIRTSPPVV